MTQRFCGKRQAPGQLIIDFSSQQVPANPRTGRPRLTAKEICKRLGDRPIELIGKVGGALAKTEWRCKSPKCGCVWQARPSAILRGTTCPSCARTRHSLHMRLGSQDIAARLLDRPIKPLEPFQGVDVKLRWKCTTQGCGYEWRSRLRSIFGGAGCPACFSKRRSISRRRDVELQLAERPIKLIGDLVDNKTKTSWLCTVGGCGHQWTATPAHVLCDGSGCPACAAYGFNPQAPAILYYLRIDRDGCPPLYKIGVTNRTVAKRFAGRDMDLITVIKVWRSRKGVHAKQKETELIAQHSFYSYSGPPVLRLGGDTELFTADVLGLDAQQQPATPRAS